MTYYRVCCSVACEPRRVDLLQGTLWKLGLRLRIATVSYLCFHLICLVSVKMAIRGWTTQASWHSRIEHQASQVCTYRRIYVTGTSDHKRRIQEKGIRLLYTGILSNPNLPASTKYHERRYQRPSRVCITGNLKRRLEEQ
jgi:hypothetical protein